MSRYRRARTPGATYFFTVNTYQQQKLFTDDGALTALREVLRTVRSERPFPELHPESAAFTLNRSPIWW